MCSDTFDSICDFPFIALDFLKHACDIDKFDVHDLLHIHGALFKAAREKHILLDLSSHKDKVEGSPFDLFFIVHNKKNV